MEGFLTNSDESTDEEFEYYGTDDNIDKTENDEKSAVTEKTSTDYEDTDDEDSFPLPKTKEAHRRFIIAEEKDGDY